MESQNKELAPCTAATFLLSVWSLIFFQGLMPSAISVFSAKLPFPLTLLLLTVPIQIAYIFSAVLPARHYHPQIPLMETLELKAIFLPDAARIVIQTILLYLVLVILSGIYLYILKQSGISAPPQMAVELLQKGTPGTRLLLIPVTALLAPIGEEFGFRYAGQKFFNFYFGERGGMFLTALIFGAAHLNLATFPALTLLGLWLSHVYRRTGSLVAPMLAHAVFNSTTLLLIFTVMPFLPKNG